MVSIEHLNLLLRMNGETLESKMSFHVKKIDATASGMQMKKIKKEFELSFSLETPAILEFPVYFERKADLWVDNLSVERID